MTFLEIPPKTNGVETRDKISVTEREVFDLLVAKHNSSAVQLEDFKDEEGYSPQDIKRDQVAVERRRAEFIQENPERHKRAQIFEAILAEQIELSDWFGSDVLTIRKTVGHIC